LTKALLPGKKACVVQWPGELCRR